MVYNVRKQAFERILSEHSYTLKSVPKIMKDRIPSTPIIVEFRQVNIQLEVVSYPGKSLGLAKVVF